VDNSKTMAFSFSVGGKIVDIKKSTGRLLTLMFKTGLPLKMFARTPSGLTVVCTLEPLGPVGAGYLYDWSLSAPYRFTTKQVALAVAAGFIAEGDHDLRLTPTGVELAKVCSSTWEPVLDECFAGRGVDWRNMREWL
jgi:hypothetical protein